MTDRPIIFSAPMVRALLDSRKTQTRRVLNPQPPVWATYCQMPTMLNAIGQWVPSGLWTWCEPEQFPLRPLKRWPVDREGRHYWLSMKYAVGDRLWVREAWRTMDGLDALSGAQIAANCHEAGYQRAWCPTQYEGDGARENWIGDPHTFGTKPGRYRHAQFMPRWASRLTLLVTDVRVQRLQDISEDDARAEGITDGGCLECGNPEPCGCAKPTPSAREGFFELWLDIYGRWSVLDNPWVCAISFSAHRCNIDAMEKQP